jgi:hypothetical protein
MSSRNIGDCIPQHSQEVAHRVAQRIDSTAIALGLGRELGVFVMALDSGGYRVLGMTASDPDGVRRLVKRLKP